MSLRKVPLRKLLQLFYAPANLRTKKIREDIRKERDKEERVAGKGGDFHAPFWLDAKRHVLGAADLNTSIQLRMVQNQNYRRLYPLLARGFLGWWDNRRRWRNEPLELLATPPGTQILIPEVDTIVKVEGTMAVESGPGFHRIIYPYFAEAPQLPPEGVRLAIWAMNQALPHYNVDDLRVLDVLRGSSFGTLDYPLEGTEKETFIRRQRFILEEWDRLRRDYP